MNRCSLAVGQQGRDGADRTGLLATVANLLRLTFGEVHPGLTLIQRLVECLCDVLVEMRDGSVSVFRVIARWSYAKEALPDRLFGRTGPAMLALVTCGGAYSEATGRYEDNIVVYAVPRG